jgi:hypothetical protein
MFPPKLPKLPTSWLAKLPAGIVKDQTDIKINANTARPEWKNKETLKQEILARYETANMTHGDANGVVRYWCVGCGEFFLTSGADAQIEHCSEWATIRGKLLKDANESEDVKQYPDEGNGYFINDGNKTYPTIFAYYAYYHDIDNLTLMCSACNISKNGKNCKNYPTFLSTGSATGISRLIWADLLTRNNIDPASAGETKAASAAGEEQGWGTFVTTAIKGHGATQLTLITQKRYFDLANELKQATSASLLTPEFAKNLGNAGDDHTKLNRPRIVTNLSKPAQASENQKQERIIASQRKRRRNSDPLPGTNNAHILLGRMLEDIDSAKKANIERAKKAKKDE